MERPDWLHEGAEVAILARGALRAGVRRTTVSRFTATRVVLDTGDWYPLRDLKRRSEWHFSELRPLNDPFVVKVEKEQRVNTAIVKAAGCMDGWRKDPSVENGHKTLKAVQAALALIEEKPA